MTTAPDEEACPSPQCPGKATAPHPCPYDEDVRGDSETLCRCCEGCEHECARDI